MKLQKGMAVINFERFLNTSYWFTLNEDSKLYINLAQRVNFSLFHESEVENIVIEIKEYTFHLRQQVLNFDSFNYIFDRQAYVYLQLHEFVNSRR
jgi:hypothetical protein